MREGARATAEGGRVPTFLLAKVKEKNRCICRKIEANAFKGGSKKEIQSRFGSGSHVRGKRLKEFVIIYVSVGFG